MFEARIVINTRVVVDVRLVIDARVVFNARVVVDIGVLTDSHGHWQLTKDSPSSFALTSTFQNCSTRRKWGVLVKETN